jgi:hypothetical protein
MHCMVPRWLLFCLKNSSDSRILQLEVGLVLIGAWVGCIQALFRTIFQDSTFRAESRSGIGVVGGQSILS